MPLSGDEIERYARHLVLHEVGGPGQNKLKNARVLVVGAGGLGAPLLYYLAAAGVGTIGIIDHDVVGVSNLQRQIIHTTARVGRPKTASAKVTLQALNPHVDVIEHQFRISADNALDIIGAYDVVADGCDNFPTRYLVSDACYFARKTLVSAAVGQFDGQLSTFKPFEMSPDETPWPSYRCLMGELPPRGLFPACEEAGILGALPGIIGSMQAMEVIKEILGIGESLAGRLLMYDALAARFYETRLAWNPEKPSDWPQCLDHVARGRELHRPLDRRIRRCRCELVESLDGVAGIHDGRSRPHVDRHAKCLEDFLARGPLIDRGLDMKGDAVIATRGHADTKGDQFLGLGVQRIGFEGRLRDGGEPLHHVRRARAQFTQGARQALRQFLPVPVHETAP